LILDIKGNVYGTTFGGGNESGECGSGGCGTVFALKPSPKKRGVWAEEILFRFDGQNGANPAAGVVFGRNGDLYGTVEGGAISGSGAAFSLTARAGRDVPWKETLLHRFGDGNDGTNPESGLIFDASGDLYGTALGGETHGGIVFRLKPPKRGDSWPLAVLFNFAGSPDADHPTAGLVFRQQGQSLRHDRMGWYRAILSGRLWDGV
jgi:hypothetical protein